MSQSRKYLVLKNRLAKLEASLLPAVKIRGNYTSQETDKIKSYVILSHAEVEAYFEGVAEDKVLNELDKWKRGRKRSNTLLALISFFTSDLNWDNDTKKYNLEHRVIRTVNHYIESIKGNHGVKKSNLFCLLLPIGIEEDEMDATWITEMDNFGSRRGLFVHSSYRVQSQIDVLTEKNRINNLILPEIARIDRLIKSK